MALAVDRSKKAIQFCVAPLFAAATIVRGGLVLDPCFGLKFLVSFLVLQLTC